MKMFKHFSVSISVMFTELFVMVVGACTTSYDDFNKQLLILGILLIPLMFVAIITELVIAERRNR